MFSTKVFILLTIFGLAVASESDIDHHLDGFCDGKQRDANYWNPWGCNSYIMCMDDGTAIKMPCPPGLNFNPNPRPYGVCDHTPCSTPAPTTTTRRTTTRRTTTPTTTTTTTPEPTTTTRRTTTRRTTTPPAPCTPEPTTTTTTTTPAPTTRPPFTCEGLKRNANYINPDNQHSYISCADDGRHYVMPCPEGTNKFYMHPRPYGHCGY